MSRHYKVSPRGTAVHPWVNKPDTKYHTDGLYHTGLAVGGADAHDFKAEIDALVNDAYTYQTRDMPKGEAKKWGLYHPYTDVLDEDGNPTGETVFKFKQNANIRMPDGSVKTFVMGVRDAKDKATNAEVWAGAIIRVMWSARNSKIVASHQFGLRLDFSMVQLIQPAASTRGFGETDGWVDDEDTAGGKAVEGDY